MLIQCRFCKGLIRCDPVIVNQASATNVQCPHCGRVGYIQARKSYETENRKEQFTRGPVQEHEIFPEQLDEKDTVRERSEAWEGEIPNESSQELHIMNVTQISSHQKTTASGTKWLRWILASAAVIVFFALLVNLILPGPTGHKFFGGVRFGDNSVSSDEAIEHRQK